MIKEPEGTFSPPCVWRNSKYLFTCSKNCCYRCLSMVCGLPIALIVGCSFACITFQHVWCIGPALRQFTINCHAVKQFLRTALDACIGPCCSTIGLLLSRIRINHSNDNGRTHVWSPFYFNVTDFYLHFEIYFFVWKNSFDIKLANIKNCCVL